MVRRRVTRFHLCMCGLVVGNLDTVHLKFHEIHLKVAGKHKIFAILREAIWQPLVMAAGRYYNTC